MNTDATVRFERSHTIEIAAPPVAVLDYVSNPNSWPEWMPATHHIDSPDRPLRTGDVFFEKWHTRQGETQLDWRVVDHVTGVRWEAHTHTEFTGPIVAIYEVEPTAAGCRYTRTIVNPQRPKAVTDDMTARIDSEAATCLENIKAAVETRVRRA